MTPLPEETLVPGEIAWRCDVVRVDDGAVQPAGDGDWAEILRPLAEQLLFEFHPRGGPRHVLIHRAGWPFDLTTFDADPVDQPPSALRPCGAGDEVMRDLIESFEAAAPGYALHIAYPIRG